MNNEKEKLMQEPEVVKVAREIFIDLATAYVRTKGEQPEWGAYPQLNLVKAGLAGLKDITTSKPLTLYAHKHKNIPEYYCERHKAITDAMQKIAELQTINGEMPLIQPKIEELYAARGNLGQELSIKTLLTNPGYENQPWYLALQKMDQFLEKYGKLSEETLNLPEIPQEKCCTII